MSLRRQNFPPLLLLLLALLTAISLGVTAQAQEDENKNSAPKTGAISGHVVNENGQPIPHATIYVSSPVILPQPRIAVTDEGGNFQVSGLEAAIYAVYGAAPSYMAAAREADSLPPTYRIGDSVSIILIKGGVITGTVTSPTGEPLVQAGVRALLIRDANGKPPVGRGFPLDRTTDDRGIYRIYGLPSGTYLVSAGGRGINNYFGGAYESDAPTFAPSSTRDTAAEITVRGGEETSGVDIRYRGDPGHAISGVVNGPSAPDTEPNLTLLQVVNGLPRIIAFSYQSPNSKGFAFYGVADGEYDLVAQSSLGRGEGAASEPRHITVKGADVSGVELTVKGFASISGHVSLETSSASDCQNKRQPLFSETLLVARRSEKSTPKDPLTLQGTSITQSAPDKSGDFFLRNLAPGRFNLNARFFAKYWYLRSITSETSIAPPAKAGLANRPTDVARAGIALKIGERVSGLTVILAEGAASFRGSIKHGEGESVPTRLYAYLVPAEKESAEDVLRFFAAPVDATGTFAFNNMPPGRYWALARVADDNDLQSDSSLRAPEQADTRAQVRHAAESANNSVEFKPCQNVIDYQLPLKLSALKN